MQLLLAFCLGSFAVLLLMYATVRLSQRDDLELSPARRTLVLGGVVGAFAFLGVLAWWAWVNPPG